MPRLPNGSYLATGNPPPPSGQHFDVAGDVTQWWDGRVFEWTGSQYEAVDPPNAALNFWEGQWVLGETEPLGVHRGTVQSAP